MGELRYGQYYGGERERSYRATNFDYYNPMQAEGRYGMPILRKTDTVPERLLGFNYAKCEKEDTQCGIHFFIDDYQFERIWSNPRQTIPRLARFRCVLTLDFSLYLDMPMAMKIWNTYRSRMIGQIMQREGMDVIPTLSWAEPETYTFCFDGIEPGGVVAVSTVGIVRKKDAWEGWRTGMDEAMRRLTPSTVLCYGKPIDYDFGAVPVRFYKPRQFKDTKKGGG
ncbi:MAG: DUF4417 domain-containing protein [Schwartzia sp.]|nr:DUF4417 domain-containing protein [Schwartzia sp. (in: firmicutes)]